MGGGISIRQPVRSEVGQIDIVHKQLGPSHSGNGIIHEWIVAADGLEVVMTDIFDDVHGLGFLCRLLCIDLDAFADLAIVEDLGPFLVGHDFLRTVVLECVDGCHVIQTEILVSSSGLRALCRWLAGDG